MTRELQQELFDKYPDFFKGLNDPGLVVLPIQFGLEIGDGWYIILSQLLESIDNYQTRNITNTRIKNKWLRLFDQKLNDFRSSLSLKKGVNLLRRFLRDASLYIQTHANHEQYQQFSPVVINQVKEKFGGLNVYYSGGDFFIDGMVWLAEDLSYKTCESCGSVHDVTQNKTGWIKTYCKKCRTELKYFND